MASEVASVDSILHMYVRMYVSCCKHIITVRREHWETLKYEQFSILMNAPNSTKMYKINLMLCVYVCMCACTYVQHVNMFVDKI